LAEQLGERPPTPLLDDVRAMLDELRRTAP